MKPNLYLLSAVHTTGHVSYTFIPETATKNLANVCGLNSWSFERALASRDMTVPGETMEQRCNLLIGKLFVFAEEDN
jgi:hypothetical protein